MRVEHRFDLSGDQDIIIQGGIVDNLTGEFPSEQIFSRSRRRAKFRASRPMHFVQPGHAASLASRLTLGVLAITAARTGLSIITSTAGPAWRIGRFRCLRALSFPVSSTAAGRLRGIGGAIGRSVVYDGDPANPATAFHGTGFDRRMVAAEIQSHHHLEFNAAFGLDNPTAAEVRGAQSPVSPTWVLLLVQNRGDLVNFIFRPRSSLLFSAEYRHLQTFPLMSFSNSADQFNLMMGILF